MDGSSPLNLVAQGSFIARTFASSQCFLSDFPSVCETNEGHRFSELHDPWDML
jgi:hypothetical protein